MYRNDKNSTKELLQIPRRNNASLTSRSKDYDGSSSLSLPLFHFLVRNHCKDIILTGANAEEYYHVELVCDNDTEYGIQAYGDEAKELYKEINGFSVPAPTTSRKNDYKHQEQYREEEKLKLVNEAISFIADSCFDNGCVLIFKKLRNICIYKRKTSFS